MLVAINKLLNFTKLKALFKFSKTHNFCKRLSNSYLICNQAKKYQYKQTLNIIC